MKAVILAAGRGSRLGKYTDDKPKCLIEIGGETLLDRELRLLSELGIKAQDVFVVAGYLHGQLENKPCNILINKEWSVKENSYSVLVALEALDFGDDVVDYCSAFATPFHAPLLQRSMADCHTLTI